MDVLIGVLGDIVKWYKFKIGEIAEVSEHPFVLLYG
jgi:hypothetical protein